MQRFVLAIIFLISSQSLLANDLDQALRAYELGQFEHAANVLNELASNGDHDAQYHLAFMYLNGEGVVNDEAKAVALFRQSAMQGNALSQDSLGHLYLNGRGIDANPAEAYAWYRLAAENNIFLADQIVKMLENEMVLDDLVSGKQLVKQYRQYLQYD
ncbi:MAG: tetratricopeptide repeat protein [Pseudomonadota bacterium]